MESYNVDCAEDEWFGNLKELAGTLGFTSDRKAYKANPADFNGQVGDFAGFIRLALACRKNTPNIYYIQKILGKDEVFRRIKLVLESI